MVIPADAEQFSIYKTIESKVELPVAYRTDSKEWQCKRLVGCVLFSPSFWHLVSVASREALA